MIKQITNLASNIVDTVIRRPRETLGIAALLISGCTPYQGPPPNFQRAAPPQPPQPRYQPAPQPRPQQPQYYDSTQALRADTARWNSYARTIKAAESLVRAYKSPYVQLPRHVLKQMAIQLLFSRGVLPPDASGMSSEGYKSVYSRLSSEASNVRARRNALRLSSEEESDDNELELKIDAQSEATDATTTKQ